MATIKADFNRLDAKGRLLLDGLTLHRHTPFGEIAADHERVIFVDGTDLLERDSLLTPGRGGSAKLIGRSRECRSPTRRQVGRATARQVRLERSRALGTRGDTVTPAGPGSGSPRCRGSP